MAGTTLQNILGAKRLNGIIQAVMGGVPDILPAGFWASPSNTETTDGNQGHYLRVEGTRQAASLVHYGSPSKRRAMKGVAEVPVTLLHTFENMNVKPSTLNNLLAEGNETLQKLGAASIAREVGNFGQLFKNLRISALYSALVNGAIYFDGEGNLLPTSSGAKVTVDFQIPATHKNQLNSIIGASWGTAGTDIIGDLEAVKKAARVDWGGELKYAFYGENVPGYLAANTVIKSLYGASPAASEQALRGKIADVGGLIWLPIYGAFFNDADGSNQSWGIGDTVVFTPEPDPTWLAWLEGTYPIPTELSLNADASAALNSLTPAQGSFSYATVSVDPPGITQYSGDTFLPIIKAVNAIFIADVVP
jgi:hypothetical protein